MSLSNATSIPVNHGTYSTKLTKGEIIASCGPIQVYAVARLAIDTIKIAFQGLHLLALKAKATLFKSSHNSTTQKITDVANKILATKESLKMDFLYLGGVKFATEYQRKVQGVKDPSQLSSAEVWGQHAFQDFGGFLRKLVYPLNFSIAKYLYPQKRSKSEPKSIIELENNHKFIITWERNDGRVRSNSAKEMQNMAQLGLRLDAEPLPNHIVNNYNDIILRNNASIVEYNRKVDTYNSEHAENPRLQHLELLQPCPHLYNADIVETSLDVPGQNRKIDVFQYVHKDQEGNDDFSRETVVIFGGNGMTGGDCAWMGKYYLQKGYNVVMPTMGGYPGSSNVTTSEQSTYEDVETVKRWLEQRGVRDIGYHGLSIGGSLAMHAAVGNSATNLNTKFVVLDQTFTNIPDVTTNNIRNSYQTHTLDGVVRGAYKNAFPKTNTMICGDLEVELDSLDNLKKMEKLKERNIPLITASTRYDFVMGKDRRVHISNGQIYETYSGNFADDLLEARYPDLTPEERKRHHISMNGGHCQEVATNNYGGVLDRAFTVHGIIRNVAV